MNISTYESRIKALEDQINPPGPSGGTGLLSVVVTPDITLSDGTTVNQRLKEQLPMSEAGMLQLNETTLSLEAGEAFSVTVTPGSDWYAFKVLNEGGFAPDPLVKGTAYRFEVEAETNPDSSIGLHFGCGAAPTNTITQQEQVAFLSFNITAK